MNHSKNHMDQRWFDIISKYINLENKDCNAPPVGLPQGKALA